MISNLCYLFKRQPHKMVKDTERIRRQQPTNCLSMFDHFVGLTLKGLYWSDDHQFFWKASTERQNEESLPRFLF